MPLDDDRLPVGTASIRADGELIAMNGTFADMLGLRVADIVGRNLIEFAVGDAQRYDELLRFGTTFSRADMGPVAASYRRSDGTIHRITIWARNHLATDGTVSIVAVPPTADLGIAEALGAVAAGAGVDAALDHLAGAAQDNPFAATACWLVRDPHGSRLVAGGRVSEGARAALAKPGPWWDALRSPSLVACADTAAPGDGDASMHRLLRTAGVRAWWARSIAGGAPPTTSTEAAIIVLRADPGEPSPNQSEHLDQMATVARLAIERAAMEDRLAHAAFHDPLTGLVNRGRFFDRPADDLVAGTALLFIDLDHFKVVNDELGHAAGDLVLVTVADRIARAVRPSDRVARLGGDEFVVECRSVASDEEATTVAGRVIATLHEPIAVDGTAVTVGASIGIARSDAPVDLDALLDRADAALRAAKRAGRGRWHLAE